MKLKKYLRNFSMISIYLPYNKVSCCRVCGELKEKFTMYLIKMKELYIVVLLTLLEVMVVLSTTKYELLPYNPVANDKAMVVSGNARFTILTPQLIRMEFSNSGIFEDRATTAIVNRNLDV